ncbi:MAG: hypothetical protein QOJ92_946 [Frankiales bacterium]|nr:hypothetical protein [Frankiales bacterium]
MSWRDLVREVLVITALFLGYKAGRQLVADRVTDAFANAAHLVRIEEWLRLPSEATVQSWLLGSPDVLKAANEFYVAVHFPLTIGFLVWAWFFRTRGEYLWARSLIATITALALAVHLLVPLAPPRLLPQLGFVDTMNTIGPSAYGAHAAAIANQYAAMPSLHVGWAMLIAVVVITTLHSRWRWLMLLHPTLTFAVVTVTANHWWLDSVISLLLLGLALFLIPPRVRYGEPSRLAALLARARLLFSPRRAAV